MCNLSMPRCVLTHHSNFHDGGLSMLKTGRNECLYEYASALTHTVLDCCRLRMSVYSVYSVTVTLSSACVGVGLTRM